MNLRTCSSCAYREADPLAQPCASCKPQTLIACAFTHWTDPASAPAAVPHVRGAAGVRLLALAGAEPVKPGQNCLSCRHGERMARPCGDCLRVAELSGSYPGWEAKD